jgi:hypothetical protein
MLDFEALTEVNGVNYLLIGSFSLLRCLIISDLRSEFIFWPLSDVIAETQKLHSLAAGEW